MHYHSAAPLPIDDRTGKRGTTAAFPSRHTPRHPAKLKPMQDQWDFVIAAYAVTALGSFGVLIFSWLRMRAAEARVDSLKDRD